MLFLYSRIELLLILPTYSSANLDCAYAKNFYILDLFENEETQHEFLMNASYWEGKFATQGDGLNYMSGLTYDGTAIDYQTGLPQESYLREFSAPSKESIHISLLSLALNNNPYALNFFSSGMEEVAWTGTVTTYVLDQLTKKITSYENFYEANSGFGGFLPWFSVNDTGLWRMDNNTASVSGQDNGEMLWALVAAYKILNDSGNMVLANRYKNYVDLMTTNLEIMFLEKNDTFAGLRCTAYFNETTIPPQPENYWENTNCTLDDPYGNELIWVYFDLYAASSDNFTRTQILQRKLEQINPVELETEWGDITVEQGQSYTVHEKWKFMFLPYFDSKIYEQVFLNGEKARTHFSYMGDYAGLFSSGLNYSVPDLEKTYLPDYVGGGIPDLGTINSSQIFYTPHATSALLLHPASRKFGIAWYANVLLGGKMQGPKGSSECISIDGQYISPIHTWDSKISTVLGFSGGIIDIIRDYMKITGVYKRFVRTFDKLYSTKFANMTGMNIDFEVPPKLVPSSGASFTTCAISGVKINLALSIICLLLNIRSILINK